MPWLGRGFFTGGELPQRLFSHCIMKIMHNIFTMIAGIIMCFTIYLLEQVMKTKRNSASQNQRSIVILIR